MGVDVGVVGRGACVREKKKKDRPPAPPPMFSSPYNPSALPAQKVVAHDAVVHVATAAAGRRAAAAMMNAASAGVGRFRGGGEIGHLGTAPFPFPKGRRARMQRCDRNGATAKGGRRGGREGGHCTM